MNKGTENDQKSDKLWHLLVILGIKLNFCFSFSLQLHAFQIAHDPNVRQTVREAFVERARITVRPTKNGLRDIGKSNKSTPSKVAVVWK